MTPLAPLRTEIDALLTRGIAQNNVKITCGKGCFHCCREPVYAQRQEVRDILQSLSIAQIEDLKPLVEDWLIQFHARDFHLDKQPNAFKYRSFNIWCPLLNKENGTCSVYDQRPFECRFHMTDGPKEYCEDDKLRPDQKFPLFPKILEYLMKTQISGLEDGESIEFDHLGILLVEELFEKKIPTESRMTIQNRDGEVWKWECDDK